jgi:hypothetical protein
MVRPRRVLRWVLPALALGVAACGSGSGSGGGDDGRFDLKTPKPKATPSASGPSGASGSAGEPVTAGESAVIRGWSNSLLAGHVSRAARYFALPSVVSNGTPLYKIETRAQARQFNRALSCGAKVVSLARNVHHFVIAKFRLAERPGGQCGTGTGNVAWTAFRIRAGRIVQWLRVPDPAGSDPGSVS